MTDTVPICLFMIDTVPICFLWLTQLSSLLFYDWHSSHHLFYDTVSAPPEKPKKEQEKEAAEEEEEDEDEDEVMGFDLFSGRDFSCFISVCPFITLSKAKFVFCLVHIKKRSFFTSCVVLIRFLER